MAEETKKIKFIPSILIIVNYWVLACLLSFSKATTDVYQTVHSIGIDQLVVIGDSSVRLLDKDLLQRNIISEVLSYPIKQVATSYPLNFILLIENDDTLTYISWKDDQPYTIIRGVSISSTTTFNAVACIDKTSTCLVGIDNDKT